MIDITLKSSMYFAKVRRCEGKVRINFTKAVVMNFERVADSELATAMAVFKVLLWAGYML